MKKKYIQATMAVMTTALAVSLPVTTVSAAVSEKEQTVYVNADPNGNNQKVIVSNWLKNPQKENTLTDKSNLNDITNVKGKETFTDDGKGTDPAPKPGDVSIDVELPVDGSRDDKPGIDGDVAIIPGVKGEDE